VEDHPCPTQRCSGRAGIGAARTSSAHLDVAGSSPAAELGLFGDVVLGIKKSAFEVLIEAKKREKGVTLDTELTVEDLQALVERFKGVIHREAGRAFPQDPREQLTLAVNAVFQSWNNKRAIEYRRIYKIPDDWGTAVNIQAMVFGNLGESSGTGVAFTRNPATGEKRFYGEFLQNAQGEDVVAGIRTPQPIEALKEVLPKAYKELTAIGRRLEQHYQEMMDIEFTVQDGTLYMLQCRVGKRTALAAVKLAVDMAQERLIDQKMAVLRVEPHQLEQLLHPMIDPRVQVQKIAKGLAASPGAAVGKVVFTSENPAREAPRNCWPTMATGWCVFGIEFDSSFDGHLLTHMNVCSILAS